MTESVINHKIRLNKLFLVLFDTHFFRTVSQTVSTHASDLSSVDNFIP